VLFKDSSGTDEIVVDLSTLRRPTVAPSLAVAMAGGVAPSAGATQDTQEDRATSVAVATVLMEWGAVWGGEWAGETSVAAMEEPSASTSSDLASVEVDSTAALTPGASSVDVPRLESEVQAAADHVRALKAATPVDSEAFANRVNKFLDLKDQLAAATQPKDSNSEENSENTAGEGDDDTVSQLATPKEWLEFPIYRLPEQATRWRLPRQGAKELAKALAAHWGTVSATAGSGKTKANKQGDTSKRGMPQIKPGKSRRSGGYGIG